ncbi:MAG: tRNA threonylcarbamoyladenosine dehydratase [Ruminococcaceae bacterium]|nr:tRNA threonylcarbamoyladenosine dehydratase [Oscillospiraceae bacterium]
MSIFERTEMLLGRKSVKKLSECHVAVFGIGGVGGHAVEALVRSGIGEITLVDNDIVSETNINRQTVARRSTVGLPKTEAAARLIEDINPDCRVNRRDEFVLPETIGTIDFTEFDYVIDAIDTVSGKLAIIKACRAVGTPVISAMGAGNKLDPTKFEVCDISKTSVCPLAAVIRRELRKAGVTGCKVVYSREEAVKPEFQPESDSSSRRQTPASAAFVPSVCGLILAGEVIKDLCRHELVESLAERKKSEEK